MKLDERDERLLALLGTRRLSPADLAAKLDDPPEEIADRLTGLADNGLVRELDNGRYARTESGRRVLAASPAGAADERIDTSPETERAIDGFDLRADEADAVRHAFSFLRYWGRASEEELVDAVYSEAPAGREAAGEWWDGLVRDALAELPDVEPPSGDGDAWRYAGTPEIAKQFADGRRTLRTHPVYGDAKHALESLVLSDAEREAARAAFRYLYRRGEASERAIGETLYPEFDAGYESSHAWWAEAIEDAFEALPGVERADGSAWRYQRPEA